MLKSYLKIAFRTFAKNPSYLFVNLIGLSVGLGCCIVIFLFFEFNIQYDKSLNFSEGAFRVHHISIIEGDVFEHGTNQTALKNAMQNDIPGIEKSARHGMGGMSFKVGENDFSAYTTFVDPDFFNIFHFEVIHGDVSNLRNPNTAILTEETAKTYFGDESPIGKTFETIKPNKSDQEVFEVVAVIKKPPGNSSFFINVIMPFSTFLKERNVEETSWGIPYQAPGLFVQLEFPENKEAVEKAMMKYVEVSNEANPHHTIDSYKLQPVESMARKNNDLSSSTTRGTIPIMYILIFGLMALLILLIACFNFTNTTISFSGARVKEVGVRKVLGSVRSRLIWQFLTENIIVCFCAVLLSIVLAELLILPQFNILWESNFEINYLGNGMLMGFLFGVLLITALLAGSYPAFYMSYFSPATILRGNFKQKGTNLLINSLLLFQFGLSMIGIIAGIVLYLNSIYIQNFDEGYNREDLIWMDKKGNYELIKNKVLNNPNIESYGLASQHIGTGGYEVSITVGDKTLRSRVLGVGENYIKTMGIEILQGSDYDYSMEAANVNFVIVSEEFVRRFGLENPIGKVVRHIEHGSQRTITGVFKDFYTGGIWSKIQPVMIEWRPDDQCGMLAVRAKPGMMNQAKEAMEASWEEIMPAIPFQSVPQTWISDYALDANARMTKSFLFLAIICTILTCAGLFAIVNLVINKKVKEIGVRKVLGATIPSILLNINKPFIVILSIATIIGYTASYFVLNRILDEMFGSNHVTIGLIPFFAGLIIIATVSIATIGRKVMKAATSNPVLALKYE